MADSAADLPSPTWHARDLEARLLVDLLRLSRVTVLYGEAGAGKTTLLKTGVLPLLARRAQDRDVGPGRKARVVVPFPDRRRGAGMATGASEVAIFFDAWTDESLEGLRASCLAAMRSVQTRAGLWAPSLADGLASWASESHLRIFLILDRFEQYLAEPMDAHGVQHFADELVRILSNPLPVNVIISMREEAKPLLERLRKRVAGLDDANFRLRPFEQFPATARKSAPEVGDHKPASSGGSPALVDSAKAVGEQHGPAAGPARPHAVLPTVVSSARDAPTFRALSELLDGRSDTPAARTPGEESPAANARPVLNSLPLIKRGLREKSDAVPDSDASSGVEAAAKTSMPPSLLRSKRDTEPSLDRETAAQDPLSRREVSQTPPEGPRVNATLLGSPQTPPASAKTPPERRVRKWLPTSTPQWLSTRKKVADPTVPPEPLLNHRTTTPDRVLTREVPRTPPPDLGPTAMLSGTPQARAASAKTSVEKRLGKWLPTSTPQWLSTRKEIVDPPASPEPLLNHRTATPDRVLTREVPRTPPPDPRPTAMLSGTPQARAASAKTSGEERLRKWLSTSTPQWLSTRKKIAGPPVPPEQPLNQTAAPARVLTPEVPRTPPAGLDPAATLSGTPQTPPASANTPPEGRARKWLPTSTPQWLPTRKKRAAPVPPQQPLNHQTTARGGVLTREVPRMPQEGIGTAGTLPSTPQAAPTLVNSAGAERWATWMPIAAACAAVLAGIGVIYDRGAERDVALRPTEAISGAESLTSDAGGQPAASGSQPMLPKVGFVIEPGNSADALIAADVARIIGSDIGVDLVIRSDVPFWKDNSVPRLAIMRYEALQSARETRAGNRDVTDRLRVIAPLYTEEIYVIARRDSTLHYIHDMRGVRINAGPEQSARGLTAARLYRGMFGTPLPSANSSFFDDKAALHKLLVDKTIDTMIVVAAQPATWLSDLPDNVARSIRLLKLQPGHQASQNAVEVYFPAIVRATNYKRLIAEDIPTLATMSFLVTLDYDDPNIMERVETFSRSLCRNLPVLRRVGHPKWKEVQPGLDVETGWPYSSRARAAFQSCLAESAAGTSAVTRR